MNPAENAWNEYNRYCLEEREGLPPEPEPGEVPDPELLAYQLRCHELWEAWQAASLGRERELLASKETKPLGYIERRIRAYRERFLSIYLYTDWSNQGTYETAMVKSGIACWQDGHPGFYESLQDPNVVLAFIANELTPVELLEELMERTRGWSDAWLLCPSLDGWLLSEVLSWVSTEAEAKVLLKSCAHTLTPEQFWQLHALAPREAHLRVDNGDVNLPEADRLRVLELAALSGNYYQQNSPLSYPELPTKAMRVAFAKNRRGIGDIEALVNNPAAPAALLRSITNAEIAKLNNLVRAALMLNENTPASTKRRVARAFPKNTVRTECGFFFEMDFAALAQAA